jgi:NadR type nicotinamide-nucleotide adenylyltransferase
MHRFKKVVVIGPESTGKTTLCEALAKHFHSLWVPEYARQYLSLHGMQYTYDDLLIIAKGQISLEEEISQTIGNTPIPSSPDSPQHPCLFIDTDMYVMKVWCEFVFGKCPHWIIDQIVYRKYDLYLLCNTDLPWVNEELREYPDLLTRDLLFHMYKDCMINQNTPWVEISGGPEERMKTALSAVRALHA